MPVLKVKPEQIVELVEQLSPEERLEILLKLAQPARERMKAHREFASQRLREIAAERGLDWDDLTEEARETFVDNLIT
ncbi:MAG: hypothetical protein KIT45_10495 [Fimbriimonadia bacterium]|nr:hypothetical protein [Fimbriimonadia bacterium]